MFKNCQFIYITLATCMSLLLSACTGSNGSSNQVSGIDGSGSTVATVASGPINGFGSVIVNGVRYNSDKATILINNHSDNENNLHTGYQVKITGSVKKDGTANADTIEFTPNLIGKITQIDIPLQQFSVLNHLVQVNNSTVFDTAISPNYLEGLALNDVVLVSGQFNDAGNTTATRVDIITAATDSQLLGFVQNINPGSFTFDINGMTINYSAAQQNNFGTQLINNSLLVSVSGTLNETSGIFEAKTVNLIQKKFDSKIKKAEIEGIINRFASATDFDVAGTSCTTDTKTTYENGTVANLLQGVNVEVRGSVNTDGKLLAERIVFKKQIDHELIGQVTTISLNTSATIATGTIQISGVTVQTNAQTAYEDNGDGRIKRFNISGIQVNDFLKISGYTDQGIFIATKIERRAFNPDAEIALKIEGTLVSIDGHSFTIYDRKIQTTTMTEFIIDSVKYSEADFFALAIGKAVEVRGILHNGTFTATRVEVKNESGDF